MKRLAIITTHPIQYYAPLFKLLHEREQIETKVFYTWGKSALKKFDPGFGRHIDWDVPLLDGYNFEWITNTSTSPDSNHFRGIINPELITKVEIWKPDAILIIGWAYQSHLKAIRHFKNKIPVYFRGDSTLLDSRYSFKATLKTVFLKWVYTKVDHAFYVGTNNKAYFKKYGLQESQLSFAPHAVDNRRFAEERPAEVIKLRNSLKLTRYSTLILFVGKLQNKKSPLLLLDAIIKIKDPELHLLFVGNGHLENSLRENACEMKNVHFMQFQNQSFLPVVYQSCDLFCLPSGGPGETWGLSVNEAMACRKAILVSDKCGCAIDLVTKKNGAIFKHNDLDSLKSAITKLTSDRQLLITLGKESEVIIHSWGFQQIADAIENKLSNEEMRPITI